MRKRFNRGAICSSENYVASKKAHQSFLKERHDHFCGMMVSGEITFDVPEISSNNFEPKFKTITIFGKEMQLSIEEYKAHFIKANLK